MKAIITFTDGDDGEVTKVEDYEVQDGVCIMRKEDRVFVYPLCNVYEIYFGKDDEVTEEGRE